MRVMMLLLVAWLAGCSAPLAQGDRSFARGEYQVAADAWWKAKGAPPDAVLFRLALLAAEPGSPLYDPGRARDLLDQLQRSYGTTVYGVAAVHALKWMDERDELKSQLAASEARLAEGAAEAERTASDHEKVVQADQDAIKALEDEKVRLTAELKSLREGKSELQVLKDENERLKTVIDELKKIDLRR